MKVMNIKKIICFCVAGIIGNAVKAQDVLWERAYGGKHSEFLLDAQPTADYGFILAGASLSVKSGNKQEQNNGDLDYWIWKMNENGDAEWQKNFGGLGPDLLYSIRSTQDGGFILAGTSESGISHDKKDPGLGKEDIWIVKLNAKGNEEWQITLGGPSQDLVKSIIPLKDGGYIVGGSSSSPFSQKLLKKMPDPYGKSDVSYGGLDYWVLRLDDKGKIIWQRTLGGEYADILESISATSDGGFILGGYSNSPMSLKKDQDTYGEGDYWIVKLNDKGETEWQQVFGGEKDDHLYSVIELKDGGYLLGGSSASGSSGNKNVSNKNGADYWIIKLNSAGELQWQETYNIGKVDMLTSLFENADGTLLIGGYAQSEVIGMPLKKDKKDINDYVVIKLSVEGEELWRETIGSAGEDHLKKVIECRDGSYILAGTSKGEISRNKSTGHGEEDFWVVKLKDKDKDKNKKKRVTIEAIPNPSNQYTNVIVGFDFDQGTASLFDLSGRLLQQIEVTSRTIPIDLGAYPVGIYIVEVHTNKGTDSVKIMRGQN